MRAEAYIKSYTNLNQIVLFFADISVAPRQSASGIRLLKFPIIFTIIRYIYSVPVRN